MSSVHTAPLAGSPETLQWRMPISPLDYPDHNPLLSEAERRGIEQLLSLSYGQWRAVAHQLAELERITKPLLDVIKLFHQRRPKSLVARKHFLDHLLGHVLHTNTVYWGWSSSRWETVIQTIPTRPKDVAQRRTPYQQYQPKSSLDVSCRLSVDTSASPHERKATARLGVRPDRFWPLIGAGSS